MSIVDMLPADPAKHRPMPIVDMLSAGPAKYRPHADR